MCYGQVARDCELSDWTEWTPCVQQTCDNSGSQSRSRSVITEEGCGGKDCSDDLNENTACTMPECGESHILLCPINRSNVIGSEMCG